MMMMMMMCPAAPAGACTGSWPRVRGQCHNCGNYPCKYPQSEHRSWSAAAAATVYKETSNKAKQSMNLTRRLQCAINQGMFEQLKGFFISLLMASITISIAVLARRVVFTGYSGIDSRDTKFWHRYCFDLHNIWRIVSHIKNVFYRSVFKYIVFTEN